MPNSEALARELQAACDAKADELEAVMATVHQQKEENIRQAVRLSALLQLRGLLAAPPYRCKLLAVIHRTSYPHSVRLRDVGR